jgi:hypothetical protein
MPRWSHSCNRPESPTEPARKFRQPARMDVNERNVFTTLFDTSSRFRFVRSSCPAPVTGSNSVRARMSFNTAALRQGSRNYPACRVRTWQGFCGQGSVPFVTHWGVAAGGAGTRAAGADRRDQVQKRPRSTPVSLRKNGHPETRGPDFVAAWKQSLLEVPVGHAPRYHVTVARAVAIGGMEDRSGGRSTQRHRTHRPAPLEGKSCSSLPRRASGQGNPEPN